MECKIVEDIGNGSPVEAERILSEILVLESGNTLGWRWNHPCSVPWYT